MQFYVIEYPGKVNNVDKVFATLGGKENIRDRFNDQNDLELKFRPNNRFCHPINGKIQSSSSLICRIRLFDNEAKADIIGKVDKICRFRTMTDYQYHIDIEVSLKRDLEIFENLTSKSGVENISLFRLGKKAPFFLFPPPNFSTQKTAFGYKFRENHHMKADGKPSKFHLIVSQHSSQLPLAPLEEAVEEYLPQVPKINWERINKMFEERKIWTKQALLNECHKDDIPWLKFTLATIAYYMQNGPFRSCWVKFGYDPRTDVTSRFLQILDFRSSLVKSQSLYLRRPHIFDGKLDASEPVEQQVSSMYQLCDIQEPILAFLYNFDKPLNDVCDERVGWFSSSHFTIIRKAFKLLIESFVDPDSLGLGKSYDKLIEEEKRQLEKKFIKEIEEREQRNEKNKSKVFTIKKHRNIINSKVDKFIHDLVCTIDIGDVYDPYGNADYDLIYDSDYDDK